MKLPCFSQFFVFIGCLSAAVSLDIKKWSYFVFAQQWPPAACLEVPGGKCKIGSTVVDWSIHGLWPTSKDGYPSFCNESWPFNPQLLKPIVLALEAKWPNIYATSTEDSFWKHEWLKHGTCATSLKSFNKEIKYFKQSLGLHDRFNIYQFLRQNGIMPSDNPIPLKYVENALKVTVNATVKLFCKTHKEYAHPVFNSMYICTDKKLCLLDCDMIHEPTCSKPFLYYLPFNRTDRIN